MERESTIEGSFESILAEERSAQLGEEGWVRFVAGFIHHTGMHASHSPLFPCMC